MRASDALSNLFKYHFLNYYELFGILANHKKDFLQLIQEQHLLAAVGDWPQWNKRLKGLLYVRGISKQTYLFRERRILLDILGNTIRQLWMIQRNRSRFVKWDESAEQEFFVFVFKWKCKSVDNTSNLENVNQTESYLPKISNNSATPLCDSLS